MVSDWVRSTELLIRPFSVCLQFRHRETLPKEEAISSAAYAGLAKFLDTPLA